MTNLIQTFKHDPHMRGEIQIPTIPILDENDHQSKMGFIEPSISTPYSYPAHPLISELSA